MSKLKGDPGYRAGWCIHYRATFMKGMGWIKDRGDTICEAGVVFDDMPRPWPCSLDKETLLPKEDGATHCAFLRPPTREEVAAHDEWFAGRMERISKVMTGIKPWRDQHKGQSAAETVECPACKGSLHLSIAAYNGHVHGQCATEGCVSWME